MPVLHRIPGALLGGQEVQPPQAAKLMLQMQQFDFML